MKLNLEIELDWINDEMSLDDVVKQQIISGVMTKINQSLLAKIESKVEKMIDKTIVKRINQATDKMFRNFMKRPVQLTDNYGSTIKEYKNITQVIKERFDNFMTETVDDNGNASNSNYGTKYKRLYFIIDKQLKDFANTFTTNAVKTVSAEIKTHVQEGLTQKLGSELMKILKVDEMLKLQQNN